MVISKSDISYKLCLVTTLVNSINLHISQALTKFLKCVNWNHQSETKQAIELLHKWDPIDPVDALELLTPQFTNKTVRQYAVSRLKQANDEVIYLNQLQLQKISTFSETKSWVKQLVLDTKVCSR